MKGRLNRTLMGLVVVDAVALFTVFLLAYSAGATAKVPLSNIGNVGLRRVAKSSEIGDILGFLEKGRCKSAQDWKGRFKENSEKMRNGSLKLVAEVFKTLLLLSQDKTLSFREKRMLDRAWQLLVSEIAVARKWAREDAESQLIRVLSKSNLKVLLPS